MMLGSGNESVFIVDVVFWMIALLSIATAIAVIPVSYTHLTLPTNREV